MPGLVQLVISGENQQAVKALEGVGHALEKLGGAGKFVEELKGKLVAALSVGAIVEFTRRSIEAADAIGKLAQKTGTAIQELSGLGTVAAADDVSLQELQIGLKGLSEWMVKTGQAGRDTTDVLLELADQFARMPDGAEKVSLAVDRFGRAGQNMIPFLNKGSEAIREQVREAEELGAVVGPAFAKSAEQFNDNQHRVGLVARGFFNTIAKELLPALNKMLEWFIEFAKRSDNFKPIIQTIVVVFKVLATAATAVAGSFEAIGAFLGQFAGTLAETGDPFEAWRVGALAATEALDRMDEVFASINSKVEEADGKARGEKGAPAAGSMLETQQKLLADAQARAARIAGDSTSSQTARNRGLVASYQEQLQIIKRIQDELNKRAQIEFVATDEGVLVSQEYLAIQADVLAMQKQRAEIMQKLHDIDSETAFMTRMRDNLQSLADSWGSFARNAADALTNSIQTGVNGVTDAIVDAIYMTKTWAQVFQQVGRAIITELIRVVVQWIVQMTIVRALQKLFHTEQQVQAVQRAAAEAPGAALASTASYGAAAIIGAVALAAILALALASAFGAFAEGGVVRGGEQLIRVNERGQEAILNAQALSNVGEGFVSALNAGLPVQQAAAVSSAAPSIKNNQQVTVAVFNDQAKMADWLRNQEGQSVIVDVVKANLHNITGRS